MFGLGPATKIYISLDAVDMRKGFDGLSGLVQECFSQDLLTGHLFLFLNRRRDRIKILYFDRDGLESHANRGLLPLYQKLRRTL